MYKKVLSMLLILMLVISCSISVFADSNTAGKMSAQRNDEIIINKGSILTYEDFAALKAELINGNQQVTAEKAKEMIAKRILEKEKMSNSGVSAMYTIWGMNLNAAELALVALQPIGALYVYNDAQTALSEAQNLYQSSTLYQGNGDAFRHAYWNALMVNDVGLYYAEAFATAHEANTPEGVDKTMDLSNNEEGRGIGQYASPSTYKTAVTNYVSWGWLYRIVNGQLVATDSSGRR